MILDNKIVIDSISSICVKVKSKNVQAGLEKIFGFGGRSTLVETVADNTIGKDEICDICFGTPFELFLS